MSSNLFSLEGKTIVVTGANKGIGKEIAIMLAEAGASVAMVARDEQALQETEWSIQDKNRSAASFPFDLTKIDKLDELFDSIHRRLGQIDVLLNNAGTNIPAPAEEVTEEEWDRIHDINLKSVFFACQAAGKWMREAGHGKIINMSSQMAFVGYYNRAAYSSSKGGITQLTKSLAIEWASHGINVNAVAPTFIETPMTEKMFEDTEFKKEVLARIPLGRLARPEDLFGAVAFLSSASSDMVTGQTIMVDGGWTVW
ncbi:2-deoxy-D-gluconate 3-dehydrogenase [Marinococcus halophilus]|uniref:SDR family NAD(P)-dependent oxidoreductase n=1 Tax=Marinococcus halophilus TaxID=1371 RepID=UPI000B9FDFA6|nr:glucose 1-dehydrogenase [Marinococcus halophilus]OZT80912.1 2-deoxy-D-gluconate 3-dehydrogenase [Marinococcus halophilus]